MTTPFLRRADAVIERGMQRIGNSRRVSWLMAGLLVNSVGRLVWDLAGPLAGWATVAVLSFGLAVLAMSKDEKESGSKEDES